MLAQARSRAVVRGTLLVGAILSLTGTIGLHVHDGSCLTTMASRGAVKTVQPSGDLRPAESHTCPVCLLYGATHVATVADLAGDLRPAMPRCMAVLLQPHAGTAVGPPLGRAPPLVS